MNYRIIRNDILKSKLISFTTMLFITAAALLVSLAAILGVNLTGAIDALMIKAETPHFLQMHSGDLDKERLVRFAGENECVEKFQVIEFLNMDGAKIQFEEGSLEGSLTDNGFSVQSKRFDYLFDLEGNIIEAKDGEVYVPLCYKKDNSTQVGEKVLINGKEFTVAGFLRDSQMNSTLAASKRFLVTGNDFAKIKSGGTVEYLIEFRVKDAALTGELETAYMTAGLEANGPSVTYNLMKTINALSDGMMIGMILLVSALVVAIAFMCIRFTLLAKIEEEYREIGVMKAIGLPLSRIKSIYFSKYAVISAAGCILGFALSFILKDSLLANIRLYMGENEDPEGALLLGMAGVLLVLATILLYVHGVLKRFRKISAAQAVRFGISSEEAGSIGRLCLSRNKLIPINLFLGVKDVISRKKLYVTMLLVLIMASFIMIVPQNLYNTINSKDFISYMGVGNCDIRIDIQQVENIPEKSEDILEFIKKDEAVWKYIFLTTKVFYVEKENGEKEGIKIELGDHSVFPIEYAEGRVPVEEDEIALSVMNAEELGKKVGDGLVLADGRELTVCGIYSDITNGGKTAQAVFSDDKADLMKTVIALKMKDSVSVETKTADYKKEFGYAKISGMEEYISQLYGQTIESIKAASYAAVAAALLIAVLVTLLFMKMLVAKDIHSIAIMKACGYTNWDIAKQYISRSAFVLIVGIVSGTLLANTLGKMLAGMVISSFGAATFRFVINPVQAYAVSPLLMLGVVLLATVAATGNAGKIKVSEHIKE